MATIVRHKESAELFVVVGSGYSAEWRNVTTWVIKWKIVQSDFRVAICSANGRLRHVTADELEVVSIDGRPVAELFAQLGAYRG